MRSPIFMSRRAASARHRVLPSSPSGVGSPRVTRSSLVPLSAVSSLDVGSRHSRARAQPGQNHSPSGTDSSGGSKHAQWYSPVHSSQISTTPAATSPPHT